MRCLRKFAICFCESRDGECQKGSLTWIWIPVRQVDIEVDIEMNINRNEYKYRNECGYRMNMEIK